jgi:hypothetical protein
MNYGDLGTAIRNYCQNSETTFDANIVNFVNSAEERIFEAVDLPSAWKVVNDAALVVGTPEYSLGAGVVDVLSVRISEVASGPSPVSYGPVRYLLQKDYDFLLEAYPGSDSAQSTGIPKYYGISVATVTSNSPDLTIRLGPAPDALYSMTTTYYGRTSSDSVTGGNAWTSSDTTETWLSVTFSDVLLYGSLVQAYTFMKGEPDMIQLYEKQFMDGLTLLKNLVETRYDGDDYRPAPLVASQ